MKLSAPNHRLKLTAALREIVRPHSSALAIGSWKVGIRSAPARTATQPEVRRINSNEQGNNG
jgi:hypothetical protein